MKDNFKNSLVWIAKIGLLIVPFIPLYVSRAMFFPYITGKALVFRFIVQVVFAAWAILAIFYKEFRPQRTKLLLALTAFVLVLTAAAIFGANPYRSFWSNFERMEGLITHFHLLAYFLVLSSVFKKRDWLIFFNLYMAAALYQNIYALFQKLGRLPSLQGGPRVDGTIGNPTYVAAYSIFVLAFAVLLLINVKNKYARVFYWFTIAFTLVTIYFTATRGVTLALFVGAILGGLIYLFLAKRLAKANKLLEKLVIAALACLVIAAVLVKVFAGTSFVKDNAVLSRFSSISLKEGASRFIIWNMAWQGAKDRPVLGWGQENFNLVFAKEYSPKLYTQEPWFDRSHNVIFDWLVSAGSLGLLAYLSILITAVYLIWQSYARRRSHLGGLNLITASVLTLTLFIYFFQNLFVFDQLATYIGFFAFLAFVQNSVTASRESDAEGAGGPKPAVTRRPKPALKLTALGLLIALTVFIVYQADYKPLTANLNLINAMRFGNSGELEKSFSYFERALASGTFGNAEIREQLAQFAIVVVSSNQPSGDFKQKVFSKAVDELRLNVRENPYDPRAQLFLGVVYRQGGLWDEARAAFEEALSLSPAKQQIYFELGETFFRTGDYRKASEILEIAFRLEPDFDEARLNLIASYILAGEQGKADELLLEGFGRVDAPEQLLTQVYAAVKDYDRLARVWLVFASQEPEKIEYWKQAANAYLQAGKLEEAIKTLTEAASANPSFGSEAQSIIEEIRKTRR